jgi:hypothetical protein
MFFKHKTAPCISDTKFITKDGEIYEKYENLREMYLPISISVNSRLFTKCAYLIEVKEKHKKFLKQFYIYI